MTIGAPTLFPFRHDWATRFQVTREWKTDVQQADNGAEVRVQLRSSPAISFKMSCIFLTEMGAGKLLATWRGATQPLRYYAPLWCDASDLTSAVTAGDATIHCDTTTRPFFVNGGFAMLFRDELHAEVVTIDTVSSASFTLTGTVGNNYALAGTRVIPCRVMWLQLPVNLSWQNGRIATVEVSFIDEKAQAAHGLDDSPAAPVASSITIYNILGEDDNQVGPRTWYAEAVVLDAGGIPIPDAPVAWSTHNNEGTGSVTATPTANSRFAKVVADTASSTITATSGSATVTTGAS